MPVDSELTRTMGRAIPSLKVDIGLMSSFQVRQCQRAGRNIDLDILLYTGVGCFLLPRRRVSLEMERTGSSIICQVRSLSNLPPSVTRGFQNAPAKHLSRLDVLFPHDYIETRKSQPITSQQAIRMKTCFVVHVKRRCFRSLAFKGFAADIRKVRVSACTQKAPNLRFFLPKRCLTNTRQRCRLADGQISSLYPTSPCFSSFGAACVILCCFPPAPSSTPLRPSVQPEHQPGRKYKAHSYML